MGEKSLKLNTKFKRGSEKEVTGFWLKLMA
jgi:hypothetical protein